MTPIYNLFPHVHDEVASEDHTAIQEPFEQLLLTVRRHLHQHPELGFKEHQTTEYISEILRMHGLQPTGPIAGTGQYVDIVGSHPGPMVAYRADIDALPIQDAKTCAYASTVPGVGHLCGHDAHTTIAIGVALLLHEHHAHLHGTVRVFFQPNEEGMPSGAPEMIKAGVLEGVTAVYAIHVDPTLDVGVYGLIEGAVTASADQFSITVGGPTTGHSARPHQVVDTVWVATQIMNALYQLPGRVTDARNAAVITITRLKAGEAYNVIPQSVNFGGTLRCTRNDDRVFLQEKMAQTAQKIAAAHEAEVDVKIIKGSPAVLNDAALVAGIRKTIETHRGPHSIFNIPVPSMGAEDFAHYLADLPGVLVRAGTAAGPETSYSLHDSLFDIDERSLSLTAEMMTLVLLNHLSGRNG